MEVYFYHPIFTDLPHDALKSLHDDPAFFSSGHRVWIVQTFLHLTSAGYDVRATSVVPTCGIVVLHHDHFFTAWNSAASTRNIVFVSVRADRAENQYADFEVLQNGYFADHISKHFIPHWPQPNLIPRSEKRCSVVKNLAFKGFEGNLHPMFTQERWLNFIQKENLNWIQHSAVWKTGDTNYGQLNWNDYSDIDVTIAIRPDLSSQHYDKPASKLVNSWMAGVPALLGNEFAFRELRQSPMDYHESNSIDDVIAQITKLKKSPELYRSVVNNGLDRAKEFSYQNTAQKWISALELVRNRVSKPCFRAWLTLSTYQRYRLKVLSPFNANQSSSKPV